MNIELILELAEKVYGECDWHESALANLEQFANLVAEHELEACIKIVMQGTGGPITRKTLDILHQERTRIALAIKEQE